jgi:hypothetical protein
MHSATRRTWTTSTTLFPVQPSSQRERLRRSPDCAIGNSGGFNHARAVEQGSRGALLFSPIEQHCQPDSIRLRSFNEIVQRGSQKPDVLQNGSGHPI